MHNVLQLVRDDILKIIDALAHEDQLTKNLNVEKVTTELPRERSKGDIATNAAMVLAKQASMPPLKLAELIVEKLKNISYITRAEIAGPGFINLSINNDFWFEHLKDVLKDKQNYGSCDIGKNKTINLEYVSANPTGPMHAGHGRGAVVGDVLAKLLEKIGYNVEREFYINDAGGQIETVAASAYLRYLEALGETITIPEGYYPGDYLKSVGQALKEKFGTSLKDMNDDERNNATTPFTVDAMMQMIRDDLAALGVYHKNFISEKKLVDDGLVEKAFQTLIEQNLIYEGVLEAPKGKQPDDWEPRPQTLFKATDFGDDIDRPLKKSDGSWTYFAKDIAYHYDKFLRTGPFMINLLGADHGGYVKRLQAAVRAITKNEGHVDVLICQLINLMENGAPVKMSKRSGTFITLREVIERVGKDVVRFMLMTRKNDATIDFDFEKVLEQSKDNPIFYVQYAHARICSVFRQAKTVLPQLNLSDDNLLDAKLNLLETPEELNIIKTILSWPKVVESAASQLEAHRIAFFLYDLAGEFHSLWNQGKDNVLLRFIDAQDEQKTRSRMALLKTIQYILVAGLDIFSIKPAEEM